MNNELVKLLDQTIKDQQRVNNLILRSLTELEQRITELEKKHDVSSKN